MKSFETHYSELDKRYKDSQFKKAQQDLKVLKKAIKETYNIESFNDLNESEKADIKTFISKRWSKDNGLNETGISFINESATVLTELSDDIQIEKYCVKEFIKAIKKDAELKVKIKDIIKSIEGDVKSQVSPKFKLDKLKTNKMLNSISEAI